MKLNWNFLGGEGVQNKKPSLGEYGYFLELHIPNRNSRSQLIQTRNFSRTLLEVLGSAHEKFGV